MKSRLPINAVEKYMKKIEDIDYSYILYNLENQNSNLEVLKKYRGENSNKLQQDQQNCYICRNTVKMYKKEDKYVQAVANLYEKEEQEKIAMEQLYEIGKILEGLLNYYAKKIIKKLSIYM